ncbi:MAG: hypothetical protein WCY88_08245 [Spongiibacteraceae bacterium]
MKSNNMGEQSRPVSTKLESTAKKKPISPDWWSKSIAGVVLGFPLALTLSGLIAWYGPGGISAEDKVQFVMWMIAPLWLLPLSAVFLCRTGLRAVILLLVLNLFAYGLLFLARGVPTL